MAENIKDLPIEKIESIISSAKRCLIFIDHFGYLLGNYSLMSNDQEKKNLNFDDTIDQIENEEAYLWFLNLINAKYTPGKNEDLSDKRDGFIPFLKVFDYLKDNNIPLLPWSYIYQNAHIYNQNVEDNYLSLEEEFTNEITTEKDYLGKYYFDDLFKIVTSKMRQFPRSNEIYQLLSVCLISEFMGKEYELKELTKSKIDKNVIKELFVKYYEKFELDLKSKIPTVVKSQEKSWTDLSNYMISLQKKIIEIRTKYLKSYKQLIHDEKVKLTIKREKLEKLFSEINHFLDINNIDPRSWESSSNFPSISEVKQMSLGPTLLSKIQIGDGDQIKGFPKIREAFFEDLKNNSLNESNLPQPTNR